MEASGAPTGHGIDWPRFMADIADVPVITETALIRQKSRDFHWYSPILKEQLRRRFGDIVVCPRNEADVLVVASACVRHGIPLTVRGAGTGNYGQAMPLKGGVILEMIGMNAIRWTRDGIVRVEAGRRLIDLEAETMLMGWELRCHPSTRRTATIGGFVAGGSTGVGAINYGLVRDRGNVLSARVVTMEPQPRVLELRGEAVMPVIHAYGCTGIVTELEIPLAPAWPWIDALVAFSDFRTALHFGQALAEADGIVKKLITPIAAPVPELYLRLLQPFIPAGASVTLCMIAEPSLEPFAELATDFGGTVTWQRRTDAADEAPSLYPPLYEFSWNHTTLHALKVDKEITYLQTVFPPGDHLAKIEHMAAHFGDEVPMHVEFVRLGGKIACFGLQLVRYSGPERLAAIIAYLEDHGCPVFNPHTYVLEDGGMKKIDEAQLAFKRMTDPMGLLNPGKMRAWEERER
jgi:FAD/FMN-containing dehydrogenase